MNGEMTLNNKKTRPENSAACGQSTASCYVAITEQVFVPGTEIDHVKCLQCSKVHFVSKGYPLPGLGWCGCDNNARTE